MGAIQKTAIILHGPPTAGKTTISAEIYRRLPAGEAKWVHLDDGWGGPDDPHDRSGSFAYSDIKDAKERVLILELAHGEPNDSRDGATRGAAEWVRLLHQSERAVFPYLLLPCWPDVVRQLLKRHRSGTIGDFVTQLKVYQLYLNGDPQVKFPPLDDFHERTMIMSGRTPTDIASEIIMRSGL